MGDLIMGRQILCPHCHTSFDEELLKKRNSENVCLVCGGSLLVGDEDTSASPKEKTTYYYYKEGGGILTDTLSSRFTPLYTFEAVDIEDAKRQLKEVMPNSPLINSDSANSDKVRCPRCRSTEIQLVPRKFSLLTGFATNKFDRMCVRCQKRF